MAARNKPANGQKAVHLTASVTEQGFLAWSLCSGNGFAEHGV
jgi:hypothetical protein